MDIALAAIFGLIAGLFSGMLGIGGGTIMVPALVLLLAIDQHTAQGVALAAMVVAAAAGAWLQYRQRNLDVRMALWIAPGAALFSLVGAWIAGAVAAEWLTRAFAIVLLLIGGRMLLLSRGGQSADAV
jgi:uncharacterized membrane protein YfcA